MTETLPAPLAAAHRWVQAQPWLWRFTLLNRLLLAMAFLPTGMVKLAGERFTMLPVDTPIGFFFEAMFQTGPYWRFIGLTQVLASILLLLPWTATLGALLFLPIGLSIVLITWGVGFGTTVIIACGMLLSVTYLLCWDADRLWAAAARVWGPAKGPLLRGASRVEWAGWILGALAGFGLLLSTRGFIPVAARRELLIVGAGAAGLVVVAWVASLMRAR